MSTYPTDARQDLEQFFAAYLPLVMYQGQKFGFDLRAPEFHLDHIGLHVQSAAEFDNADNNLRQFSEMMGETMFHGRRNRVYRFREPLSALELKLPGLEIFEATFDTPPVDMKYGIEHISFQVQDFDRLVDRLHEKNIPISRETEYHGQPFIKTVMINTVKIEFRKDFLVPV